MLGAPAVGERKEMDRPGRERPVAELRELGAEDAGAFGEREGVAQANDRDEMQPARRIAHDRIGMPRVRHAHEALRREREQASAEPALGDPAYRTRRAAQEPHARGGIEPVPRGLVLDGGKRNGHERAEFRPRAAAAAPAQRLCEGRTNRALDEGGGFTGEGETLVRGGHSPTISGDGDRSLAHRADQRAMESAPRLVRGIGARGAVALNTISMIGIGPLITIPLVLGALHGPLSLVGWLAGALLAACDGLVWAELGSAYPVSGGT